MRSVQLKLWVFIVLVVASSWAPSSARGIAESGLGPALTSIGPLAFGPDGTLFAADNQAATIYGIDLAAQGRGAVPARKGSTASIRRSPHARDWSTRDHDHRSCRSSDLTQRLRIGDAWPGRGRGAGAAARRRRGNESISSRCSR
jgi:hypothetical protein